MRHRLGLATRTQISVCKSPFPSAGTAVPGSVWKRTELLLLRLQMYHCVQLNAALLSSAKRWGFLSQTFPRRLPPSTNYATDQRLVSSTCHGRSQLSVLHLAVEPFTAHNRARYWFWQSRFLPTPTAIDAPIGGGPVGILPSCSVWKNQNCRATRRWKNFEDMFICLDRVHECDGQTDGQTDGHSTTA